MVTQEAGSSVLSSKVAAQFLLFSLSSSLAWMLTLVWFGKCSSSTLCFQLPPCDKIIATCVRSTWTMLRRATVNQIWIVSAWLLQCDNARRKSQHNGLQLPTHMSPTSWCIQAEACEYYNSKQLPCCLLTAMEGGLLPRVAESPWKSGTILCLVERNVRRVTDS